MKELEKEFEGKGALKGVRFKQILQNNYAYIYEVRSQHKGNYAGNLWYEVFVRKEAKADNEPYVIYPTKEAFREWAWKRYDLNSALNTYLTITNYYKDKWSTELERNSNLENCD